MAQLPISAQLLVKQLHPRNMLHPLPFCFENWFDAHGDDRRRDDETKTDWATNQFPNKKKEGMEHIFGDGAVLKHHPLY